MRSPHISVLAMIGVAAVAFLPGCIGSEPVPVTIPVKSAVTPTETGGHGHDHHHEAGPHHGTLADWGGGKYHVEFTVDHDKKQAVVYILGDDEKAPSPIDADTVLLSIKDPEFQVELKASPLEGEPEGQSSRFVGVDDKLGKVQEFQGTISAEVDGTPYVGEFKEEPHSH